MLHNAAINQPTNVCFYFRYILVDWLVEVAGMKDFSSHTLHVAVNVVDRYLKVHKTSRSQLQLLGVAAMVLCSRCVFSLFFKHIFLWNKSQFTWNTVKHCKPKCPKLKFIDQTFPVTYKLAALLNVTSSCMSMYENSYFIAKMGP